MATKKKSTKSSTATKTVAKKKRVAPEAEVTRGRKPTKGGLQDKIAWVERMFVDKGKTRPKAIEGLLEKYPDMTKNYAKTLVYSYMQDQDWTSARGETKPKKAAAKKSSGKAPVKKQGGTSKKTTSSKKKKKKVVVEDDDSDDFDDF